MGATSRDTKETNLNPPRPQPSGTSATAEGGSPLKETKDPTKEPGYDPNYWFKLEHGDVDHITYPPDPNWGKIRKQTYENTRPR